MQSEEFGDEGIGVLLEVIIVIFEDGTEEFILAVADGLQHVLAVCRVVEERSALALAGERGHGVDLAHHEGGHESVGADAADVVLVVDFEDLADVVEGVGSIVGEGVNGGVVFLIAEPSGDQFEVILEVEVLRLLVDHLLEASHAPHRHLDADHHVQH